MEKTMIRIIIADDHPIVREGLKRIVENHFEGVVIDEVGTGEELLNKIWTNAYDLILLDISMPGRGGLEVLDIIKKKFTNLNVLVLSIHDEDEYALRVIRAGASGYLTKDIAQ
jgi:DNA-binding NarL/FixJ family response regulator